MSPEKMYSIVTLSFFIALAIFTQSIANAESIETGALSFNQLRNNSLKGSVSEAIALKDSSKIDFSSDAIEKMEIGETQNVIILFDDSFVKEDMNKLHANSVSPKLIHKAKKNALSAMKNGVLSKLQWIDTKMVKDYRNFPLATVRVDNINALAELAAAPGIVRIFEDRKLKLFLSQSLPLIQQPAVASSGLTGKGTTVAVLDTGLDYTDPAFGACTAPGEPGCSVVAARDIALEDGLLDDPDYDLHGTNVAGIVVGVAPDTKIAALDVFVGGSASDSDIIAGLNWVVENRTRFNIVAVNMSLGGGRFYDQCANDVLAGPLTQLRKTGVLTAVATGNDGWKDSISSPACVPDVISVGAVYDSDIGPITWETSETTSCTDSTTNADQVTCFSNSNDTVTLLAPGALINSAGITMAGTSQATPHVAGAIAALHSQSILKTATSIENRLVKGGVSVTDARNGLTIPRLDLSGALDVSACEADATSFLCTLERYNERNFRLVPEFNLCDIQPLACEAFFTIR